MLCWLKRKSTRYCGFGGTPYELTMFYAPDCYVKEGSGAIATFETMSLKGTTLHIDHFAMDHSLRGSGKAEQVLRGFARLVAEQTQGVKQITFDLHRSLAGDDIEKLACARSALLERIGARNVRLRRPNENCICVAAVWDKADWSK